MDPTPSDPQGFVNELFANAKAGNKEAESEMFSALDGELEAATTSAGTAQISGRQPTSLISWLQFLMTAVRLTAAKEPSLCHFEWSSRGQEAFGGGLLRRLYGLCGSASFNYIKVAVPEKSPSTGIVLLLGMAGGSLEDMAPFASWWGAKHFTCIQTVKTGSASLASRQVTKLIAELIKHNVAALGLVVHIFSENGFTMWGLLIKEWAAHPREGLPPLQDVLRGCVYDSCSGYGLQSLVKADTQQTISEESMRGYVRNVVLRSIMGLATRVLSPNDACLLDLAIDGPIAKCSEAWYGRNTRGLQDCPVLLDFTKTWFETAQSEPAALPRICFFSDADKTVPASGILVSAEWSKSVRGEEIEMVRFEKTQHCEHHKLDDGKIYFSRLSDWLALLFPSSSPTKSEEVSQSRWEVVGGAEKGGILVREGEDLKSMACNERLATGSTIEELALVGQRLHYKLLSGSGPGRGWISLKVGGKDLVCPKR